jgi:hypothetical protein
MRAGDPATPTHRSDTLSCYHGISLPYIGSTEVEIAGHQSCPVVDVYDTAREIEIGDQCHHTASSGADRCTDRSGEIGTEMTALHLPVIDPRRAESAGNARPAGKPECPTPDPRVALRDAGDLSAPFDLRLDPDRGGAIGPGIGRRDGQRFAEIARPAHRHANREGVASAGQLQEERHEERVRGVDRNGDQSPKRAVPGRLEVKRLTGNFTAPHPALTRPHPKPSNAPLLERGRLGRDGDTRQGVLPLGGRDGQGSESDSGGDELVRVTGIPPCRRDVVDQRSPLTSVVGEGADPSGARQGSLR